MAREGRPGNDYGGKTAPVYRNGSGYGRPGREYMTELVEENQGFVVRIASEYKWLGLSMEDLVSEGNIGLVEAAHRYDSSRGVRFTSYAVWWIRKSIARALDYQSRTVRLPSARIRQMGRIRDAERNLEAELGREPEREEIAKRMGESRDKINKILKYNQRELSIERYKYSDRDRRLIEDLSDGTSPSPEDAIILREDKKGLLQAIERLTEQERDVIEYRYGLYGGPPLILKEIGEKMGISRERVRQVEVQTKARLRRLLRTPMRPYKSPIPAGGSPRQPLMATSGRRHAMMPASLDDMIDGCTMGFYESQPEDIMAGTY